MLIFSKCWTCKSAMIYTTTLFLSTNERESKETFFFYLYPPFCIRPLVLLLLLIFLLVKRDNLQGCRGNKIQVKMWGRNRGSSSSVLWHLKWSTNYRKRKKQRKYDQSITKDIKHIFTLFSLLFISRRKQSFTWKSWKSVVVTSYKNCCCLQAWFKIVVYECTQQTYFCITWHHVQ